MSSTPVDPPVRAGIEHALYSGSLLLDDQRFAAWLELTAPELRYRIEAYSPEIRKQMTWLDHDRKGLAALVELLARHHVDGARWARHVVLYTATREGEDAVAATSSLAIFHTAVDVGDVHVDGGSSRLFAIGRYHDRYRLEGGRWLLADRTVRLDTRQLGIGTHLLP